jgi:hypothetical protein
MLVSIITPQALFNDMLKFSIAPPMTPKIIVWVMKNASIPLNRTRRVVLGTSIGTLGTGF